jgi:zinc/manganese transport system substrate-binding protein/manganese/iron transport system substrate-binding protein
VVGAACGSDNQASTPTTSAAGAGSGSTAPARVLNVVTTTTQITDFVRNIGGDQVKIYAVLKANVDPHDYEPTPVDLDAIAKADVIVKNGVELEKWFGDTIRSAGPKGPIIDASRGVTIRSGSPNSDEPEGDPHLWHNPQNAKLMVANIAHALEAVDPVATPTFERNLAAYSAQLEALDADIKAQIATLANKKLVTNHDAFGYYVDHFGLEFVGSVIPSFDSQAELSPGDINDLVAKVKAQGVKAIFSESSLPPKTAEAIAAEAGVKVVDGADALYGDTLGPEGSDGDTYLKMEEHNTREIVANLG